MPYWSSSFSTSIYCSQCKNNIMNCACQHTLTNSTTTSIAGYGLSGNTNYTMLNCSTCGQSIGQCFCSSTTGTFYKCQTCGGAFGQCSCQYTINVPFYQPAPSYTIQTTTWPSMETISDYDVLDTENKELFKTKGNDLTILHRDEKEGLYVKLTSLHLPIAFKECFYQLKKTGGYNLWQIRSPLAFRFNLPNKDNSAKIPHFFALQSITDATLFDTAKEKANHYLSLAYPHFQEIVDQLELIRLVEIQRVFTKLLGRL